MKKNLPIPVTMTLLGAVLASCGEHPKSEAPWVVDRFDDIKVIRYEVPGFEQLPLEQKDVFTIALITALNPRNISTIC